MTPKPLSDQRNKIDPRDVVCPLCGAAAGDPCVVSEVGLASGALFYEHAPRWAVARQAASDEEEQGAR